MKQTLSTHGIGASEIAAICGMNPYASPWNVWLRKTGQAPDVEEGEAIEWGHRLEPAIRQKYADLTRATMYVPTVSLFHAETTWARATPDAIVLASAEPLAEWCHLVQAKNVGYWPGKDWEEGPPAYVTLQEQWEMYVTGLDRADVAALIAGSDYRVYTVHREERMIDDLVTIAADFWRRVESRRPPKIDDSTACRDHFVRGLRTVKPVELVADAELNQTMADWFSATEALKRADRDVKRHRNTITAALVEAQADHITSTLGTAKLSRTPEKTTAETNWRLVAELTAVAPNPREVFADLVAANTTTTTTEASVSLREPRHWCKERT